MREIRYHEIPDAYRAQTLARAEEVYGRESDPEAEAWWAECEEAEVREDWQNERAEVDPERFVSEADYNAPDARDLANLAYLDDLAQHSLTL